MAGLHALTITSGSITQPTPELFVMIVLTVSVAVRGQQLKSSLCSEWYLPKSRGTQVTHIEGDLSWIHFRHQTRCSVQLSISFWTLLNTWVTLVISP